MPFRALRRFPKHLHGLPLCPWAYHFFESTALKPTMSRACSATSCFNLRFSSSTCRGRCASEFHWCLLLEFRVRRGTVRCLPFLWIVGKRRGSFQNRFPEARLYRQRHTRMRTDKTAKTYFCQFCQPRSLEFERIAGSDGIPLSRSCRVAEAHSRDGWSPPVRTIRDLMAGARA